MANYNLDRLSLVEGEYDTTASPHDDCEEPVDLCIDERTEALDRLVSFMAEQLNKEKRCRETWRNFRKKHVRKVNFQNKQVAPVVEKIKQKYSYTGCPECARRYQIFEAVVLRGEDPSQCSTVRHLCSPSVRPRPVRRRKAYENEVSPVSVDSERSESSFEEVWNKF